MRKFLQVTTLAVTALTIAGCGPTKIGRILADPMHYRNREVTVEGRVTGSVGAFIAGGYQVQDETGKITVVSGYGGVPARGAIVKTRGYVTPGMSFMGKGFGTTIRETHHKIRW